ncbi:bifunctional Ribosomal protein L1 [Babesia duncani]|uniref:Bifunctional Ribosomal protein L1 n=1 Tax=Babesia duncani TaxID=323732 RepID=A0AAD9PIW7_9APIC|nr:bifunctional Ribosomal protein L1 [Babesia duncani]
MINRFGSLETAIKQWRRFALHAFGLQLRLKKYIPLYTEIVKRRGKKDSVHAKSSTKSHADTGNEIQPKPLSLDDLQLPSPQDAINVLKSIHVSLFNNTNIQLQLWVWTRVEVTRVALRGCTTMPFDVGPKPKVLAICEPEQVQLALNNGATYAGLDSVLDKIASGWTNFDACICTTIHMPKLMRVARILGPKKLMPNLKSGTLTSNLIEAIKKMSDSKTVQYRAEQVPDSEWESLLKHAPIIKCDNLDINQVGIVQVPISQMPAQIPNAIENSQFFIKELLKSRPTVATKSTRAQFKWPPEKKTYKQLLDEAFTSRFNQKLYSAQIKVKWIKRETLC